MELVPGARCDGAYPVTISTDVSVRQSFLERTSGQNGHRLPSGPGGGEGAGASFSKQPEKRGRGLPLTPSCPTGISRSPFSSYKENSSSVCPEKGILGSGFLLLPLLQWTLEPETRAWSDWLASSFTRCPEPSLQTCPQTGCPLSQRSLSPTPAQCWDHFCPPVCVHAKSLRGPGLSL